MTNTTTNKKMNDQEKSSRISLLSGKLDDCAYSASSLLLSEIDEFGISNITEMASYLFQLRIMEQNLCALTQEYDVEYHNTIIPMVRAFRQEQEKLEQKYKNRQTQAILIIGPTLMSENNQRNLKREMEQLKAAQATAKRDAISRISAKMNHCKDDIRRTFIRALNRMYQ